MLNEAEAGTFVPAGDAGALTAEIVRMAGMPRAQRLDMGARGRAWLLAHRSYEVLAREYVAAIEPLLEPSIGQSARR